MATFKRISIFVMHEDDPTDFMWVEAWIRKWKLLDMLRVQEYSSGGWEHYWDIETSPEAVAEVPKDYLCDSEWANSELFGRKTKK